MTVQGQDFAPEIVGGTEAERITELIAPAVHADGLVLEAVQLRGAGATRTLQVQADLPASSTEGVELDRLAELSRAVSELLDEYDAVSGPAYELEVSSPGATRELTAARHWRRSLGRTVSVHPLERSEHGRTFQARLLEVADDDASVVLQRSEQVKKGMPVKLLEPETWPLDRIRSARVVVEA